MVGLQSICSNSWAVAHALRSRAQHFSAVAWLLGDKDGQEQQC